MQFVLKDGNIKQTNKSELNMPFLKRFGAKVPGCVACTSWHPHHASDQQSCVCHRKAACQTLEHHGALERFFLQIGANQGVK